MSDRRFAAFLSVIVDYVHSEIEGNLAHIRKRIEHAAIRSGRLAEDVNLLSVSKTHPPSVLREAIAAGVTVFGENKVREAESKIAELGRDAAEWHLIGHLQSNKARLAVQLFDVIHSIDSLELATRLERICEEEGRDELTVLVQIDLSDEETKSGVAEDDLPKLAQFLKACRHLHFTGVMILPPFFDNPEATRPFFRRLRAIRDDLAEQNAFAGRGELSMGMSHDFEVAIEEGSTIVRVGTAIFGQRVVES